MKTVFQKRLSLVLAFLMIFSMFTVTASAELTYDGTATISALTTDITYERGDVFCVYVELTGGKFHGIEYALTYDSTALELYQVYNGDEEAFVEANEANLVAAMEFDMAGMPECTLSAGVVSVAWAKSGSAKTFNDATILTLMFKVIAETGAAAEFGFSKFLASVCVDGEGNPTTVAAGNPATYATMNKVGSSVTIAAAPATPTPEPTPTNTPVPTATPTQAPVDTGLMQVTDETLESISALAPWDIAGPGFTAWSWEITGDVSQVFSKTTDSAYVTDGTSAILANLEKAGARSHVAGGCYLDYTANNLEEGKTYKLTFKMKAVDVADRSKLVFDVDTEINTIANTISVISKSGRISNEWSEFEIVFTAHPATSGVGPNTGYEFAGHTCIRITVGATEAITGFLAIDDMAIVEVAESTATPTPAPTATPTNTPVPTATPTPVKSITLTASAASATVTEGTQNTVTVVMSGNTGVAAMQFELAYDSSVLSVASATAGLGGKGSMDINTATAGKISIAWVNTEDAVDYTGNDAVVTIVFDTIAAGNASLTLTDKGAYSADETKIEVTAVVVDFAVSAVPTATPTEAPTATNTPVPTATPTEVPAPELVNLLKISEEETSTVISGAYVGAMNGNLNGAFGSWVYNAALDDATHIAVVESEGALYGDKLFRVTTNGDTSWGAPSIILFQDIAEIGAEAGKTYTFFAKISGKDFTPDALASYFSLYAYRTDAENNNLELGSDAATWRGATVVDGSFDWTVVKVTFTLPDDLGAHTYFKFVLPGYSADGMTSYFDAVGLVEGEYDHATLASTVIPALFGEPNALPTPTATPTPVPTATPTAVPTATPTAAPDATPTATPIPVDAVTGIAISATSATLDIGEKMYLSASVVPANAANKAINWYVSESDAVSVVVSDYGIILIGEKAGTAVITAESVDGGYRATCVVTVTKDQYKDGLVTEGTLTMTPNGGEIVVGQSIDLDATISPAIKGVPLFYSNNIDVAYVDLTSGVLTAVAPGTVVITAIWSDTLVRTVAVFTVVETATVTPAPTLNGEPSDWAKAEIIEALTLGLVPEHINGNYTNDITRSQFCDIIINLIEKKSGKAIADVIAGYEGAVAAIEFTDTNSANVKAASQLGIVNGRATAGIFDPDANITRQEAAKMLATAAKVLGADITAEPVNFADADAIYDWAKEFVYYVNSISVMNGTSTGENPNFSPIRTYSIEQSILTILRLFKAEI